MWSCINYLSLETLQNYYIRILYTIVVLSLLTTLATYVGIKINQRINDLQSKEKKNYETKN